ncbi:hypothetical protein EDD91_3713 [Streptomyces sp. KS 21]|nr:hypothetical protein EDD91_3713 [Streptomyces sp. KS 21]
MEFEVLIGAGTYAALPVMDNRDAARKLFRFYDLRHTGNTLATDHRLPVLVALPTPVLTAAYRPYWHVVARSRGGCRAMRPRKADRSFIRLPSRTPSELPGRCPRARFRAGGGRGWCPGADAAGW